MVQYLAESIQGVAVVKGFGREAENREKFEALNRAVLTQQYNIFWWVSLFSPTAGFLTRINTTVLLGYGGWLVAAGRLPLGAGLVVFAGLLDQFAGQVNNVATIVNSVQQSLIGARRVFEILDAPIEVRTPARRRAPAPLRGRRPIRGRVLRVRQAGPGRPRHQPRGEARRVRGDPRRHGLGQERADEPYPEVLRRVQRAGC